MRMVLAALVGLTLSLSPALADPGPADCAALAALVRDFTGYEVKAPVAGPAEGWCVLDGARLTGDRAPQTSVERLRLAGTEAEGELLSLEIDGAGLRLSLIHI